MSSIRFLRSPLFSARENRHVLYRLWMLLFVLFAAVITGENACEALLVTRFGYAFLPKMYALNAALLFAFMPLLFFIIDKVERGRLLLRVARWSAILVLIARALLFAPLGGMESAAVIVAYVLSYLSKISLFILFWTLANDISHTRLSKDVFPLSASGGIAGGMAASILSKTLLAWISVENLFFLWALFLLLAWPMVNRIRQAYSMELQRSEYEKVLHGESAVSSSWLRNMAGKRLIWMMSLLYFLVFVVLFGFDFQFSKTLSFQFKEAGGFAAFRYNFYIVQSVAIILLQWVCVGFLFRRFGSISSLFILPVLFCFALSAYWLRQSGLQVGQGFWMVAGFQLFRQTFFESLFSPGYQIFFSSLRKEIRGRAKVLLEGVVKPGGILVCGVLLYVLQGRENILFLVLLGCAIAMIGVLVALRKQYLQSLLEGVVGEGAKRELAHKISEESKEHLPSLLDRCLQSPDVDLKRVAVIGLSEIGSKESFMSLQTFFRNEEDNEAKEFAIKYLGRFGFEESKRIMLSMCDHANTRFVSNALYALRHSAFRGDDETVEKATRLLDHPEIRVNVEASLLLWELNRMSLWSDIEEKIHAWMESDQPQTQVAAIYLVGQLQNVAWVPSIWKGLLSAQSGVWTRSVDVLAGFHFPEAWEILADYLLKAPRNRQDRIVRALGGLPASAWGHVQAKFLEAENKRSLFALIEILRRIALNTGMRSVELREAVARKLRQLLIEEMEMMYREIYCLLGFERKYGEEHLELLRSAVFERRNRMALFMFDMTSLFDRTGQLLRARAKYHDPDPNVRSQLIEMLTFIRMREVTSALTPLMESSDLRVLGEFGDKRWGFREDVGSDCERTMLESSNTWIQSVTLFTLRMIMTPGGGDARLFQKLAKAKIDDPSSQVASCAREYLDTAI